MTRKEFTERSKEIMAATELSREKKAERVKYLSARLIDDTFSKSPEGRDFWKRYAAAEKRLAGYNGFSYCPHNGEWSPDFPPAIKALDREYVGLLDQKIGETYRKVWA